jgi:hypothetical protein
MNTKVTFHNSEDDELELGPYPQGVVLEPSNTALVRALLVDVATSKLIARLTPAGWSLALEHRRSSPREAYRKVFIQETPKLLGMPHPSTINADEVIIALNDDWREDPTGGNAMALREIQRSASGARPDYAKISDVLGGHERWLLLEEWESWRSLVPSK